MKKSETEKTVAHSYRLLSIRPRSEKELRGKLREKGFGHDVIQEAVSLLKESKIIDDAKFAELFVESRMRTNPKGKTLLKKELIQKGIEASIIEKVLGEESKDEDSLVRELARKKMETLKKEPKEKIRRKLFSYLAQRGFDFEIINEIIREYVK